MSRFDYVKYDERSIGDQSLAKDTCERLERLIDTFPNGRSKSIALTKLEETYMWTGKMIRDEQISRNGTAEPQEERKDG